MVVGGDGSSSGKSTRRPPEAVLSKVFNGW